jgi:hydroxypyruvate isomerase
VSATDTARLSLAISLLAGDAPPADRVARAVRSGYRVLESWWPWAEPAPAPAELDAFVAALADHDARLHLLNLTEGAERWGGRGIAGLPDAADDFRANSAAALELGARTGVRWFNVLAGNIPPQGRAAGLATLEERVLDLARRAAPAGIGLVIEQLNPRDHPDYLLLDPAETAALVGGWAARADGEVALLADVYHLTGSGADPEAFVAEHAALIGHVQLADFPGRGRPGTGGIAIGRILAALDDAGYSGMIGLEYLPDGALPAPDAFWKEIRT